MGFLSFLLMTLVQLFPLSLDCSFPPSLWWHMLGSRVGLLYLSELRREVSFGMLVTIPQVRRSEGDKHLYAHEEEFCISVRQA